ncbi:NUDIX domain-containing protein [Aeromicrobium wangtongii]|uniref:NUDIX hydrolase n=1 Tax=Aeromicrobium wangtongii TaxID=2969247 RepID=A0ABY5M4D1_9ACTN|nr:NUDIX hydrolase [Aeromicrobium wangtongii]MCD9198673.1 NUDIX hydrolase [Aeromicrobium wangtongii]UUP12697.1 NUDIX hydrolase [Aeromicrobium wangtongii]
MTQHPSLPGRLAGVGVADSEHSWPVTRSETVYDTPYIALRTDVIVDPSGAEHTRAVVSPHGAVAVVALDEDDRVLLVEQYRHAVQRRLIELPAGTLDVEGESPINAAKRELAEEADIVAEAWTPLLQLTMTPGHSTERIEVFLATGLSAVADADRTTREAEEADMAQWWMPLGEAVDAVLSGRITDSKTVAALLAVQVSRSR